MGSGGGGGGDTPSKRKSKGRGGGGGGGGGDASNCELTFETELSAIEGSISQGLSVDDILIVGLENRGNFQAVVCRTQQGDYVGTVSHIENLAQLVGCIRAGVIYHAHVRASSRTHCSVLVLNA